MLLVAPGAFSGVTGLCCCHYYRQLMTRGWGIFEAIDMCNAMGVEPIITLHSTESYQDLADLVHYLFGQSTNDTMAALRVADGHPEPYRITYFEVCGVVP